MENLQNFQNLIGDVITEEEIWACTTCRNCEDQCPVMNEHVDKIIDAVLLNSEDVEEYDSFTTAAMLSKYLEEQEYDIILGGNVAVDGGSGQVGPRVAEALGIPQVTTITDIKITNGVATIVRDVEGDKETVEVSLPVLPYRQWLVNLFQYLKIRL